MNHNSLGVPGAERSNHVCGKKLVEGLQLVGKSKLNGKHVFCSDIPVGNLDYLEDDPFILKKESARANETSFTIFSPANGDRFPPFASRRRINNSRKSVCVHSQTIYFLNKICGYFW